MSEKSVFEVLNSINVNDKTEKKNGLTYLSWAWAWGEVKKRYPSATYQVYEDNDGKFYHTDGKTCWVKTGVTIEGIEYIDYLPVMDNRNRSIAYENVTSFDANKAIQRSLTKAIARHGLGLYIYAGEDIPENETTPEKGAQSARGANTKEYRASEAKGNICTDCGAKVDDEYIIENSKKVYGRLLCKDCCVKERKRRKAAEQQTL